MDLPARHRRSAPLCLVMSEIYVNSHCISALAGIVVAGVTSSIVAIAIAIIVSIPVAIYAVAVPVIVAPVAFAIVKAPISFSVPKSIAVAIPLAIAISIVIAITGGASAAGPISTSTSAPIIWGAVLYESKKVVAAGVLPE